MRVLSEVTEMENKMIFQAELKKLVFILSILICFGTNFAQSQTNADQRVALVIGNSEYASFGRLLNPKNDAAIMAKRLQESGFRLIGNGPLIDLNKPAFDKALQDFGNLLEKAEVGLFYYAGHGMQVQGTNWLIPIDANPANIRQFDFQMVDANLVLRQMEGTGTKLNMIILDACRNNPFASRGVRSSIRGLAEMRAPEGTIISYSTQPGNVAEDGSGENSPYTEALSTTIREPDLDIFRFFNRVGLIVKRATNGVQQPWMSSSPIDGDFYFNKSKSTTGSTASTPTDPTSDSKKDTVSASKETSSAKSTQSMLEKPILNRSDSDDAKAKSLSFVSNYFLMWSKNNTNAMSYMSASYAPFVNYFGIATPRSRILSQKQAFVDRWPQRSYSIREGSSKIDCNDSKGTCSISGIVDWECRNEANKSRSSGTSSFSFSIAPKAGKFFITAERSNTPSLKKKRA